MMRRMVLILLLLIGGAIANVAVAWGFCAYSKLTTAHVGEAAAISLEQVLNYMPQEVHELRRTQDDFAFREDDPRVFNIRRSSGVVHTRWTAQYRYTYKYLFGMGESTWAGPPIRFAECRAGWPLLSMRSMQVEAISSRFSHASPTATDHAAAPTWRFNEHHIEDGLPLLRIQPGTRFPYKVIWPGFLLNTAIYASALGAMVYLASLPFAARRTLRRKRGLCTKCAYPVGTSPVCTECGAAVAQTR